jgi:uncharacterized protein (TIGR02996 family)
MSHASSLRKALEDELTASPDDLATHAAYADLLGEAHDPRGEYIQIQLTLEDTSLSPEHRSELLQRQEELWHTHRAQWLGPIAPHLLDTNNVQFSFRRGWLDSLEIVNLSLDFARALRDAPEARLLRRLVIENAHDEADAEADDNVPDDEEYQKGFWPLVDSDSIANVRVFQLGVDQGDDWESYHCYQTSAAAAALVRGMHRLEEVSVFSSAAYLNDLFTLPTLKHLRVLKAYHAAQVHRLDLLAANPTFAHLTHLLLHPHSLTWHDNQQEDEKAGFLKAEGYIPLRLVEALVRSDNLPQLTHLQLRCSSMGDDGVGLLIQSGFLRRLQHLDLRHGRITDAGARLLAQCPHTRSLAWLDLGANTLSDEGADLIESLGIPCSVSCQHPPGQDSDEYLGEGDWE